MIHEGIKKQATDVSPVSAVIDSSHVDEMLHRVYNLCLTYFMETVKLFLSSESSRDYSVAILRQHRSQTSESVESKSSTGKRQHSHHVVMRSIRVDPRLIKLKRSQSQMLQSTQRSRRRTNSYPQCLNDGSSSSHRSRIRLASAVRMGRRWKSTSLVYPLETILEED